MARKISDAERMMAFVRTAPIATVHVVLDLAKAELKARGGQATVTKRAPKVTRITQPTETPNAAA